MKNNKIIEADHFKHYKYPWGLIGGKDGNMAFSVSTVNMEENKYVSSIFHMDHDEKPQPVPHSENLNQFLQDVKLQEQFSMEKEFSFVHKVSEDQWIVLCKDNLRLEGMNREEAKEEENYFIAEEVPFWSDEAGSTNRIRNRLYLYQGGMLTRLTSEYLNIEKIKAFGDEVLAYYGSEYTDIKYTTSRLFVLHLDDFTIHEVRKNREDCEYVYVDIVLPDKNHMIAVRSDRAQFGEYQNEYIDKIDLETGDFKRLNGDCRHHIYNSVLSDLMYGAPCQSFLPYQGGVLFISTIIDKAYICCGDFESGSIEVISDPRYYILEMMMDSTHNRLYFTALEGKTYGPELFRMDLISRKTERLSDFNRGIALGYRISKPEPCSFAAKDGTEILGFIMKPAGFTEGVKYKTVLAIHGGPNVAYGSCLYHELQYIAAEGYGVIFCNPRGSIGRGAEFSDLRKKYYTVDYEDIISFADDTLDTYQWIDREHMAVMGGSYGGMMVNWIIGHTDRFRAAISDRGVASELSDFFTSDIGLSFTLDTHGGTPWEEGGMEAMWEKTPVRYAPQVKTPTLFIHGEADRRCTKEQSLIMFAALKYNGVPAKVLIAKGEGHGLCWSGSPRARVRRLKEMVEWLKAYL
ncbi:MAG: S9 family peptidase [Eubacteriales bacterium]|nr:S9 family peptidase [Eubacteriales bacterium]